MLETLNHVFSISQKWDLPGSSTKRFNCKTTVVELNVEAYQGTKINYRGNFGRSTLEPAM